MRGRIVFVVHRLFVALLIVSWLFSGWPQFRFGWHDYYVEVPPTTDIAEAVSWYSPSWQYRKQITISSTYVGTTTTLGAANFPTLISEIDSDIAKYALDNCTDLVFTSSDGITKLAHEVESCNGATGEFNAWVNTALSSTTDTTLYMYYGGYGDQQDVKNTWEEEYAGVWHLDQDPTNRAPQTLDSTRNNNDGASAGAMTSSDLVNGRIVKAIDFDGSNDRIDVLDSTGSVLDITTAITISGWVNYGASIDAYALMLDKPHTSDAAPFHMYAVQLYNDTTRTPRFCISISGAEQCLVTTASALSTGTWHHVAATYNGATQNFQINGQPAGSRAQTGSIGTNNMQLSIAANVHNVDFFNGLLDEIRLERVARTAADLSTQYNNMNATSTFYTIGNEDGRRAKVRLGSI